MCSAMCSLTTDSCIAQVEIYAQSPDTGPGCTSKLPHVWIDHVVCYSVGIKSPQVSMALYYTLDKRKEVSCSEENVSNGVEVFLGVKLLITVTFVRRRNCFCQFYPRLFIQTFATLSFM